MSALLMVSILLAETTVFPLPPEKVDPSTVAVTNEYQEGWWRKPYHERYRIIVDFDFDGHDDMILSEPMANFGTGGGCWGVYHWTNGQYQVIGDIGAHYAAWSFDRDPETGFLRFWSYWHSSCQTGHIGYNLIEPCKVQKSRDLYISLTEEEGDAAMAMYNAVLGDHGIRHRYEESLTTNGVVMWRRIGKWCKPTNKNEIFDLKQRLAETEKRAAVAERQVEDLRGRLFAYKSGIRKVGALNLGARWGGGPTNFNCVEEFDGFTNMVVVLDQNNFIKGIRWRRRDTVGDTPPLISGESWPTDEELKIIHQVENRFRIHFRTRSPKGTYSWGGGLADEMVKVVFTTVDSWIELWETRRRRDAFPED